jgi:hypothetical protein
VNRRFGETYRLHLQGRNIRERGTSVSRLLQSKLPPAHAGSSLADFSTLKMEAIRSSETSVHTRSTRRYIPENGILHSHRCQNLKSYLLGKFANLCYNRFIQPNSLCNYEAVLKYLHLKTLNFKRRNLDALYLINVFKNRIDCCSVMDTLGLRVRTKQLRGFSIFTVSNVSGLSPSTRCVTAANKICKSLDVSNKLNISLEDTFYFA